MNGRPIDRVAQVARLASTGIFDLVVIGGGATGTGLALDAAARGLSVALFESDDFAKGTSSRATKLVHGGVRYLAQGDIALVREALHERTTLLDNAPHVAQRLAFVVPGYHWWNSGFYGVGLKAYDVLAGRRSLGRTEWLTAAGVRALLPNVNPNGLSGGVRYWDGQFDDARLAVLLARTAQARGALVLNRCPVIGLRHDDAKVDGVVVRDDIGGTEHAVRAACVVNATGVWVDRVLDMDARQPHLPIVAPSQGVHLVVDRGFLPGSQALMVPRTSDGRVLFAVPWLGKTILGTTDTPRDDVQREPAPLRAEVDFILGEAARYLARAPKRDDVRSVWVGMRPLVKPTAEDGVDTKAMSREHTVRVAPSGLVTVTGGKWTTYRAMAEDVLDCAMRRSLLPRRAAGVTERLALLGAAPGRPLSEPPGEHLYGSEAATLRTLPGADDWLWRDAESGRNALSAAMVRFAVRYEMALTVEDVLARRCRLLFLDAAEAARQADAVAAIMADELGVGFDAAASSDALKALAAQYAHLP